MSSEKDFSWSGLFIVTTSCCLLFNIIIRLLDGEFSPLLFIVGGFSAFLAFLNWSGKFLARASSRRRRKSRLAA